MYYCIRCHNARSAIHALAGYIVYVIVSSKTIQFEVTKERRVVNKNNNNGMMLSYREKKGDKNIAKLMSNFIYALHSMCLIILFD